MKIALAFATLTIALLTLPQAQAAVASPVGAPLYTCAGNGLSRVSMKSGAITPDPAPCCTGSFGCPQLLSNTGLVKPTRGNRT